MKRFFTDLSLAKKLATLIVNACPECRERAVALTNLEQAIFWANASIARRENDIEALNGVSL